MITMFQPLCLSVLIRNLNYEKCFNDNLDFSFVYLVKFKSIILTFSQKRNKIGYGLNDFIKEPMILFCNIDLTKLTKLQEYLKQIKLL